MSELKPCPFCRCGGEPQHMAREGFGYCEKIHSVQCRKCDSETKGFHSGADDYSDNEDVAMSKAADAWNTRADGWIPVGDATLIPGQVYLCWDSTKDDSEIDAHMTGVFDKNGMIGTVSGCLEFEITHVMPINPPGKGEINQ